MNMNMGKRNGHTAIYNPRRRLLHVFTLTSLSRVSGYVLNGAAWEGLTLSRRRSRFFSATFLKVRLPNRFTVV